MKHRVELFVFLSALVFMLIVPQAFAAPNLGVYSTYGYLGEGFQLGPSGSTLSVWVNNDVYAGKDIWLLCDSAIYDSSIRIDGAALNEVSLPQIDGYTARPYYGIDLGTTSSSGWAVNPQPIEGWGFDNGTFYTKDTIITYSSLGGLFGWFFAVDDNSSAPGLQAENSTGFSPKTVSTTVPIPGTLLLLGSGLLGFVGIRRRMK